MTALAPANSYSELLQLIPAGSDAQLVARLKETNFELLPPCSRAFAIEFVTGKGILKSTAQALGLTQMEARREYNSPATRAFIAHLQDQLAQQRLVNATWAEQRLLEEWPKLTGEEEVNLVSPAGEQIRGRKYHAADVTGILKNLMGDAEVKKNNGVTVNIDFGSMGIAAPPMVNLEMKQ